MIFNSVRVQVLKMEAGCLDRDLFQQERQEAMVSRLLLLVLDENLAVVGEDVLIPITHELTG